MSWLRRAWSHPVSVYPATGEGGVETLRELARCARVHWATSPRHASVLLVTGRIPERAFAALRRLHDQMPHPRASVCWGVPTPPLEQADCWSDDTDAGEALRRLQRLQVDLLSGRRRSDDALLPDEPPFAWRGQGDHGQGGEGMMGGRPYGRPMTMTGDDLRDGLSLDSHRVTVGPFAPMFPAGLELGITLQGDVVQDVALHHPPFDDPSSFEPYRAAVAGPASLPRLERQRASHHLRCVARLLQVRGLQLPAQRLLHSAWRVALGERVRPTAIRRSLLVGGLLVGIEPALGVFASADRVCLSGPARRAAGDDLDARSRIDAYRRCGFRPVTQNSGDVRGRLRQWLDEACQSLALASALDAAPARFETLEGAAGAVGAAAVTAPSLSADGLKRLLAGRDWGQAVTVLASFDPHSLRMLLRGAQP